MPSTGHRFLGISFQAIRNGGQMKIRQLGRSLPFPSVPRRIIQSEEKKEAAGNRPAAFGIGCSWFSDSVIQEVIEPECTEENVGNQFPRAILQENEVTRLDANTFTWIDHCPPKIDFDRHLLAA